MLLLRLLGQRAGPRRGFGLAGGQTCICLRHAACRPLLHFHVEGDIVKRKQMVGCGSFQLPVRHHFVTCYNLFLLFRKLVKTSVSYE